MKLGPTWDHYSRNTEIPGPYLKSYLDFCLADVVRDLPMVLDYLLSHLAFSHAFQITLQMQKKNGGENKKRDIHHNHPSPPKSLPPTTIIIIIIIIIS